VAAKSGGIVARFCFAKDLSDVVLVMTGSGLLSLPKFASSRSAGARRFSLAVSATL
jgi:hypothetical protein